MVISEKAEILTKCLEKEIAKNPGKAINIFPFINNAALDIICGNKYTYMYHIIIIYDISLEHKRISLM